ncbi:hypothetical protein ABW21_db0205313 [Orbilia brochopaga]|nr:hypothetical protein ABW21_db0205313 [Drechslerella brochopaga]
MATPNEALRRLWITILEPIYKLKKRPDRVLPHDGEDDAIVFLDDENHREVRFAWILLRPTAQAFLRLKPQDESGILSAILATTQFVRHAEQQINVLQNARHGRRWRVVYSYAALIAALEIGLYVQCPRSVSDDPPAAADSTSKQWTIQDAIYYLDFALIKTGGWPVRKAMHTLLAFIDTNMLPTLDPAHRAQQSLQAQAPGTTSTNTDARQSIEQQEQVKLKHPGPEARWFSIEEWQEIYRKQQPAKLVGILDHWPLFDCPDGSPTEETSESLEAAVSEMEEAWEEESATAETTAPTTTKPRRSRWSSVDYILSKTINGRRIVPVEIGKTYRDPNFKQKIMTIRDYMTKYLLPASSDKAGENTDAEAGTVDAASKDTDTEAKNTNAKTEDSNVEAERTDAETKGTDAETKNIDTESEEADAEGEGTDIRKFGYLAQHNLLYQIPSLRDDICIPDYINFTNGILPCITPSPDHPLQQICRRKYCPNRSPETTAPSDGSPTKDKATANNAGAAAKDDEGDFVQTTINAWLGPAGTISPPHTDPYQNIFCQAAGRKYLRLYHPDAAKALAPMGTDENGINMSNTSGIPLSWIEADPVLGKPENKDPVSDDQQQQQEDKQLEEQWERFQALEYVEFVVEPGEAVFIPKGWWHYVRALEGGYSFSVNFWWEDDRCD